MAYNLKQWLIDDGERVLLELRCIMRKAGIEAGDLQSLRDFVDSLVEIGKENEMKNSITLGDLVKVLLNEDSVRIGPWVMSKGTYRYELSFEGAAHMPIATLDTAVDILRWLHVPGSPCVASKQTAALKDFFKHIEESMPVEDVDDNKEAWDKFHNEIWEISYNGKTVRIPNGATIYNGMFDALKECIDNDY